MVIEKTKLDPLIYEKGIQSFEWDMEWIQGNFVNGGTLIIWCNKSELTNWLKTIFSLHKILELTETHLNNQEWLYKYRIKIIKNE